MVLDVVVDATNNVSDDQGQFWLVYGETGSSGPHIGFNGGCGSWRMSVADGTDNTTKPIQKPNGLTAYRLVYFAEDGSLNVLRHGSENEADSWRIPSAANYPPYTESSTKNYERVLKASAATGDNTVNELRIYGWNLYKSAKMCRNS